MMVEPTLSSLSDLLKRRRLERGETQREAAVLIGVSQTTYSRWESSDASPNVRQLPRIARYLDMKPRTLAEVLMAAVDEPS